MPQWWLKLLGPNKGCFFYMNYILRHYVQRLHVKPLLCNTECLKLCTWNSCNKRSHFCFILQKPANVNTLMHSCRFLSPIGAPPCICSHSRLTCQSMLCEPYQIFIVVGKWIIWEGEWALLWRRAESVCVQVHHTDALSKWLDFWCHSFCQCASISSERHRGCQWLKVNESQADSSNTMHCVICFSSYF